MKYFVQNPHAHQAKKSHVLLCIADTHWQICSNSQLAKVSAEFLEEQKFWSIILECFALFTQGRDKSPLAGTLPNISTRSLSESYH